MTLCEKDCPKCSWPLHEIWKVGETPDEPLKLRGWYCPHCLHYDGAILRERKFTIDHKGEKHTLNGQ